MCVRRGGSLFLFRLCGLCLCLLLLRRLFQTQPGHGDAAEDGGCREGDTDVERVPQCLVVHDEDGVEVLRGDDAPQVGGADVGDKVCVDARDPPQAGGELVVEHVVGDADEDGATQGLREEHHAHAGRDVLARQDGLRGHAGLLHAKPETQTPEDLVPDPFGVGRRGGEGGDESCADRGHDARDVQKVSEVAEFPGREAREHAGDGYAQHGGDVHNARVHGRGALDGLEPDGQEVDQRHHLGAAEEGIARPRDDGAMLHQARGDGRELLAPVLDVDKDNGKDTKEDQEDDDAGVGPRVRRPAPLQSQKEADDGREDEQRAQRVELVDLFLQRRLG